MRLRQEKADLDYKTKTWNLTRLKFEVKYLTNIKPVSSDDGIQNLNIALEKELLTKEAYDWALENKLSVDIVDESIYEYKASRLVVVGTNSRINTLTKMPHKDNL